MRKLALFAASTLGLLTLASGADASSPSARAIPLPPGVAPEGVVTGKGNEFFVSNLAGGGITRGDLKTGAVAPFVTTPAAPVSAGLAYDKRHQLLFAAGGPSGRVAVYDARTGATVAAFTLATAPTFVNDVITTGKAAYATDSQKPVLYELPIAKDGTVGAPRTITLSGPAGQFVPGFNLNGIVATEDGTRLIVVNSTKGELYSVNPRTGSSITIDLGGESVAAGDGMWLDDETLYVVRNRLNTIAVFELNDDEKPTKGTLVDTITSPLFEVPTTMAIKGDLLVAVNAQFGLPQPNPFEAVVLKLHDHD